MSRAAIRLVASALLACLPACGSSSVGPSDECALIPGISLGDYEAGVARHPTVTCTTVGGTPVSPETSGRLQAAIEWQDPDAKLRLEIWKGPWETLLASREPVAGRQCLAAAADVDPGLHIVRVCHATSSAAAISDLGEIGTYTRFSLRIRLQAAAP